MTNTYDYELINVAEQVVKQLLDSVIANYKKEHPKVCTCQRCKIDILAVALNNIKPAYVVTNLGRVMKQVSYDDFGGRAAVLAEIVKAVDFVNHKPNHS
jgi:competence protein ComFB